MLRARAFVKICVLSSLCLLFSACGFLPTDGGDLTSGTIAADGISLTGPGTLTLGPCSSAFLVRPQLSGSAIVIGADLKIDLKSSGSLAFYSDAACSKQVSSVYVLANSSFVNFYVRGGAFQDTSIVATPALSTVQGAALSLSVVRSIAAYSLTAPGSLGAGMCSGPIGVSAMDGLGVAFVATSDVPLSLNFPAFLDAGCQTTVSPKLMAGQSAAQFYIKPLVAGSLMLQVSSSGVTASKLTVPVNLVPAKVKLAATNPAKVYKNFCYPFTVQLQDFVGGSVAATSAVNVDIGLLASPGSLYSDGLCQSPLGSPTVTFNPGSFVKTFYLKPTAVVDSAITVAAPTLAGDSANFRVAALQLTLNSAPLIAGVCSGAFTLHSTEIVNGGNVDTAVGDDVTVSLASTSAGSFYPAGDCSGIAVTSVKVLRGSSTALFYFKPTADPGAGGLRITASSTQLASVESQLPVAVDFRAVALSGPSDAVSHVCTGPYTVSAKDGLGRAFAPASGTAFLFSQNPAGLNFYSDSACNNGATGGAFSGAATKGPYYVKSDTLSPITYTVTVSVPTKPTVAAFGMTLNVQSCRLCVDTAYGVNGLQMPQFTAQGIGLASVAVSAVAQGNKRVLAGTTTAPPSNGKQSVLMVRQDAAGVLDGTFGNQGAFLTDFDPDPVHSVSTVGMVMDPATESFYVAVNVDHAHFGLMKFSSDGSLAYKVVYDRGGVDDAKALTIAGSRVIIVGNSGDHIVVAAAKMADGALDSTFGTSGFLSVDVGAAASTVSVDTASSVVTLSDGNVVLGGATKLTSARDTDFLMVKLLSNGAYDASFGSNDLGKTLPGMVVRNVANRDAINALLPYGTAVIGAGYVNATSSTDFGMIKVLANGAPDTSFGSAGIVQADLGGIELINAIGKSPYDGTFFVAGTAFNPTAKVMAARFTAAGALDSANPTANFQRSFSNYEQMYGAVFLSDTANTSKLLIVGAAGGAMELVQLLW